ncbi:alpha/beta-hydrolase [Wolfiporia cocos MD-104 SS10]|uniref:Alpha/beta-hydrolase n=1 Tax=Wolfiporia cocos (strain MD-104) TaxID=742152 RepID=A0A2H3JTC9_WOLCO|nr:alpha/beta-hydrolase [Wolfiporia cocos MD-104 SS10]
MSIQGRFLASADGTKIWAEATGDLAKPALVMIHGLACTAFAFDRQFLDTDLTKNLYLVRYEMRGHGRSDMPDDVADYSSLRQAQDFDAVCKGFGLTKPFVLGWSLGGCIPVDIAAHLGTDYIAGVIYCGGPLLSLRLSGKATPPAWAPTMQRVLSTDPNIAARSAVVFVDSCVANPSVDLPWPIKLQWMGGYASQPPHIRNCCRTRGQDDSQFLAEAVKRWPALLIQGSEDSHCLSDVVIQQARDIFANVETHLIRGVGHAPHFERPTQTNSLILKFIRGICASQPAGSASVSNGKEQATSKL